MTTPDPFAVVVAPALIVAAERDVEAGEQGLRGAYAAALVETHAALQALREERERLRDGEGSRPTEAGGPGKEEKYWLRAKLNASIRHLRDVEDYYRVEVGGEPDSPNMIRADRARSLYEQITEDFLNGNVAIPTMRERAEKAEAERDEAREALRRIARLDDGRGDVIARAALGDEA